MVPFLVFTELLLFLFLVIGCFSFSISTHSKNYVPSITKHMYARKAKGPIIWDEGVYLKKLKFLKWN